jgi:antirestriction protein ArdC
MLAAPALRLILNSAAPRHAPLSPPSRGYYVGSWLSVLREDEKAIFRVASAASKAADYLLGYQSGQA